MTTQTNKKSNFRDLCRNFKVSKYAKIFGIIPLVVILVALIIVVAVGTKGGSYTDAVGIGIDFEGGTILTVTLGRDAIDNFDEESQKIKSEIEKHGVTVSYIQQQRANSIEKSSIAFRYKNISRVDKEVDDLNTLIRTDVDNLYMDRPGNVEYESVSPTAAQDLLSKAAIALVVSVAIILVYIIIRFTLMSGFAAIIALIHDAVIMFALTVICRVQINSSYVAAMITIIAYSINNTIIIFDRCRELMKPLKGQRNIDYVGIGDEAVRATFTRSVYTTFTTMVTVIFLAALGGDAIREFCVPIILGLVAGMFSSVCLATPLWAAMSASFDRTREKYSKRNSVVYEKKEDEEELVLASASNGSSVAKSNAPKQAGQKQNKGKVVYKYSKKNTTFKKK
ncbi:MAG: protein translocase subunit SecF [Clostridia bacterium]|nr:protein translocase subunit SecF [Clostridia bacterium]